MSPGSEAFPKPPKRPPGSQFPTEKRVSPDRCLSPAVWLQVARSMTASSPPPTLQYQGPRWLSSAGAGGCVSPSCCTADSRSLLGNGGRRLVAPRWAGSSWIASAFLVTSAPPAPTPRPRAECTSGENRETHTCPAKSDFKETESVSHGKDPRAQREERWGSPREDR